MIKDKTHSEYVKKMNEYRAEATETQKALKLLKTHIGEIIKAHPEADMKAYFELLGVMRITYRNLCDRIKDSKKGIKAHQRYVETNYQKRTYRMYSMVLRQLSPMQKGIQALHAVAEYGQMAKRGNLAKMDNDAYNTWANRDKTMIVLDAGISSDLVDAVVFLKENNIPFTTFHEPDLYGCMTAISFLADERVFDAKTYPSYEEYISRWDIFNNPDILLIPPTREDWVAKVFFGADPEPILKFREFIFSKKLSM